MKHQNWIGPALLSAGFFVFSLFAVTGCTRQTRELSNRVVVKVNDSELRSREFADRLAEKLRSHDALAVKDKTNVNRAKDEIVKEFIVESITQIWAREKGLLVRKEDLESEVDRIRSHYPDDLAFRRALAEENLTFKEWQDKLRQSLLQRSVSDSLKGQVEEPTDEELKTYYQNNKDEFQVKEQVRLRQIVLANQSDAKRIEEELKDGKKLADLAGKFSIAPESKEGGDIGWIEKGTLDIFDKAFSMREGQKSSILKSPFGYHIIEVLDKKKAQVNSFDDVKDKIRRALIEKREQAVYSSWLESQIRKAKVFKDEEFIANLKVETRSR